MTLKTKNIILDSSTAISASIFVMHIVFFSLFSDTHNIKTVVLFCNSIYLLTCSVMVHIYYKKSLPSEIIFYAVFLASLSIQSIRIIPPLFESDTFILKIIVGRISLFFKYAGLLSILGASLFSYIIKKQKIGSWILSSFLCSFVISSMIHFNTGIILSNMLPKVIFSTEELVISFSLVLTTVFSFLKSGFDSKNIEYFYMAIASIGLTLTMQLSFISLNIASGIIMALLFISGSILYLNSTHKITLWG